MAQAILRLSRKALCVIGIVSALLLIQKGDAYEFKVGGPRGSWTVPSDPNASIYNQWAEKTRFQVGDTLLFVYDANSDSVLHVTKDDYTSCNTRSPLERFTDGHTVFKFNQSGPYYFISGDADNCHKNEKMVAIVMADRSKRDYNATAPSSSPSPSPSEQMSPPAPAPAGEESPPPAPTPAGEGSPSPAPTPAGEESPPPAPSQESSPPKKSASSTVISAVGAVGALIGSSLALAI